MTNSKVYKLVSEDLSGLGSSMGTEHTSVNWERFFIDANDAKEYAQKDYRSEIKWKRHGKGGWISGDLRFVMYTIRPITVY